MNNYPKFSLANGSRSFIQIIYCSSQWKHNITSHKKHTIIMSSKSPNKKSRSRAIHINIDCFFHPWAMAILESGRYTTIRLLGGFLWIIAWCQCRFGTIIYNWQFYPAVALFWETGVLHYWFLISISGPYMALSLFSCMPKIGPL